MNPERVAAERIYSQDLAGKRFNPNEHIAVYRIFVSREEAERIIREAYAGEAKPKLLEAAKKALDEMCRTVAPRTSFTDAVDLLDDAITATESNQVGASPSDDLVKVLTEGLVKISRSGREWSANRLGGVFIQRKRWENMKSIAENTLASAERTLKERTHVSGEKQGGE